MTSYLIITLGCKVNQCESAALGHSMETVGYVRSDGKDAPDVIVVNTCTVTGKAAMQSRQAIRQARRRYPSARIVVTGCYAQTSPDEIKTIAGVDMIVGHDDKLRIAELLVREHHSADALPFVHHRSAYGCNFSSMPSVAFEDRTRAFLKIQDGCNTRCTYCIVPYARGQSRSMPVEDVLNHMRSLAGKAVREVVLTGIHLGVYGADLEPSTSLANIIETILANTAIERIRLSSIEPAEVEERIVTLPAQSVGRVCRHFHIPLQSGDNGVLRRMGRPYTREAFFDLVSRIHALVPGAAIGVDVMAGFPGESEAAFDNTYQLLDALPITYLHVFPYSPRKGTPAATYPHKIPESTAKERCRRLRDLGERKRTAFYHSMIGERLQVLTETRTDPEKGLALGLSDNYVPVAVVGGDIEANRMISVRITAIAPDGRAMGRI